MRRWQKTAHIATVLGLSLMFATMLVMPASADTVTLHQATTRLVVSAEDRTGYDREAFPHWMDEDRDGCNTRKEVLLAEATMPPKEQPWCGLSGGQWYSYYDCDDAVVLVRPV